MNKRLLTVLCIPLLSLSSINAYAASQYEVKLYIEEYKNMLRLIQLGNSHTGDKMIAGNLSKMKDYDSLDAAIDVLQLIQNGEFDACCWSDTPVATGQSLTTGQLKAGGRPSFPNGDEFTIPTSIKADFRALSNSGKIFDIVGDMRSTPYSTNADNINRLKQHEFDLISKVRNFFDDLSWNFSYTGTNIDTSDEFKDRYAYACVVCFGAGFYDLSKLYTKSGNTYNTKSSYVTVFNKMKQSTKTWMNGLHSGLKAKTGLDFSSPYSSPKGTPIQISIGPTYQGSANKNKGFSFSDTKIYPAHCHNALEIYKFLDPVGIIRDQGDSSKNDRLNTILTNDFGTFKSVPIRPFSYASSGSSPSYVSTFKKTFVDYMYNVWSDGYKETELGSWTFNDTRDYHSMHAGDWMQLTAWSRLTNPTEGTSFPINGGSQPVGGSCKQPL